MKADFVRKLHQRVKERLEEKAEKHKARIDKKRKEVLFEPGDLVWLHMRPERFPDERKSKLSPRGTGPFRVLEKINDNAYKLDLPSEFKISPTFNVSDLSPFQADDDVLRSEPSQEGGNDAAIDPNAHIQVEVPILRRGPTTRSGTRALREGFSKAVQAILKRDDAEPDQEIEGMIQVKIQDLDGTIKTEELPGPTLFSTSSSNRAGLVISTSQISSGPIDSGPIESGP